VTAAIDHVDITATRDAVRRRGAAAVTEEVLEALAAAPDGVLIGRPLVALARANAARVDASTTPLPLAGVPFVVKDNIDVGGVATTAACPGFAYVADRDAAVVATLRAAGAIPVAKANLDQFATGLVGTRSPYGTPPNASDPALAPGGSSSGSAVAVALGLVPFAIGTDTAGSGRVPAALNGIVGLKPTVGRYDITSIVPAVRRFDCPSVFARSVIDATIVAAAMGPLAPLRHAARPWAEPVIGVPDPWPTSITINPDIDASFTSTLDRLAHRGPVRALDVEPLLALGRMLYGSALLAERSLTAGDAIRRGLAGLDPVVAEIISGGDRFSAEDAYRAEYELADRRAAARRALAGVDVLALPTTVEAPTLADVAADPVGTNTRLGTFTTFANLLDAPVIAVPLPGSVPAGLQLIGSPWHDDGLAAFAATA